MTLSPRQTWQLQEHVRLLWNELNQAVNQLDQLKVVRDRHGPEVTTALDRLMTPQEWQAARNTLISYRDILKNRIEAARGEELDPPIQFVPA